MTVWRPSTRSAENSCGIRQAEMLETGTEERPERLAAATACGANEGLELREAELDGIEVRAIGWQVPEGGPGSLDGALDAGDFVGPEIVSALTMSPGCRVGTRIWSM